ncbi:hypothetical protein HYH03_018264 [Edaphochlamys debaryana]|uniref:Uncharacterized protein n=1 Tax=Edaphochlamys debaryana TaxID=47281 RepID=A0A835XGV4_9CHLO|nr:hypothetical protein HYH03_018264 [Edaphochlamys debaryana]|eukprot:KAG2482827.1 hypothetical protein HYH03_018264 [Edaphochlamys debaryana]
MCSRRRQLQGSSAAAAGSWIRSRAAGLPGGSRSGGGSRRGRCGRWVRGLGLGPGLGLGCEGPVLAALRGGHAHLAAWLRRRAALHAPHVSSYMSYDRYGKYGGGAACGGDDGGFEGRMLAAAAEGCGLPVLTWLCDEGELGAADGPSQNGRGRGPEPDWAHRPLLQRLGLEGPAIRALRLQRLSGPERDAVLAAAVRSPTPDWRAKVEWLEAALAAAPPPEDADAETDAAAAGGGRRRRRRRRGLPGPHHVAAPPPPAVQVLTSLIAYGVRPSADAARNAAARGQVAAAAALAAAAAPVNVAATARHAAAGGHVDVMTWMQAHVGLGLGLGVEGLAMAAASSGAVEALEWVERERQAERGAAGAAEDLAAAAGSEPALEWLLAHGASWDASPPAPGGGPYERPSLAGDLPTLAALRRLAAPLPPGLLAACVGADVEQPVLTWLTDAGAPVDWGAAEAAAWEVPRPGPGLAWLASERRRRGPRLSPADEQDPDDGAGGVSSFTLGKPAGGGRRRSHLAGPGIGGGPAGPSADGGWDPLANAMTAPPAAAEAAAAAVGSRRRSGSAGAAAAKPAAGRKAAAAAAAVKEEVEEEVENAEEDDEDWGEAEVLDAAKRRRCEAAAGAAEGGGAGGDGGGVMRAVQSGGAMEVTSWQRAHGGPLACVKEATQGF